MDKSKKTEELESSHFHGALIRVGETSPEVVDPDVLQLMDECNKKWVGVWSKQVKRNSRNK